MGFRSKAQNTNGEQVVITINVRKDKNRGVGCRFFVLIRTFCVEKIIQVNFNQSLALSIHVQKEGLVTYFSLQILHFPLSRM